jgi:hypothetical protein
MFGGDRRTKAPDLDRIFDPFTADRDGPRAAVELSPAGGAKIPHPGATAVHAAEPNLAVYFDPPHFELVAFTRFAAEMG